MLVFALTHVYMDPNLTNIYAFLSFFFMQIILLRPWMENLKENNQKLSKDTYTYAVENKDLK